MSDPHGAFLQAHSIKAGNIVVGQDVVIHGGLSSQLPAEPDALLREIAQLIERHRAALPLADDLLADVEQIEGALTDGEAPADQQEQQTLRARINRLAAGVGSVGALAGTVQALVSALGL